VIPWRYFDWYFGRNVLRPPRLEAVQRAEHLFAQERNLTPGPGELHAPAPRMQDRLADRLGKLLEQPRYGGLRERQLARGARDAAQAHARFESDQLGDESMPEEPAQAGSGHARLQKVRQQRSR
jgi:hypothetical protein